ncbi:YdcF family protein [Cyclobacterium roseum]|uniref:YdcF family protein n=1 Tax=Cyclobacterium roseum TaxID=2666137 RepID=UPI001391A23D|nr:YdcF family protein [Cyclobacterium roseum]
MLTDKQPPVTQEVKELARRLWDYHQLRHTIQKSDAILVLGSHDPRVAERGAALWLEEMAPLLIFSGGLGNFTAGVWEDPEAVIFGRIARRMGVPDEAMLLESRSTNSGENIRFTQELLKSKGLDPHSFIIVQKPYMERRAYATFKKYWPDKSVLVTSPRISLEDYPSDSISLEIIIQSMVGDLQRIREYPKKGFQIHQDIPEEVWTAFERLVALGFDQHLIS